MTQSPAARTATSPRTVASWSLLIPLGYGLLLYLRGIGFPRTDTLIVASETSGLLGCLRSGTWIGCKEAGYYAPLQKILALPMVAAGIGVSGTVKGLAILGFVATLLALTLIVRDLTKKQGAPLAHLFVAALACSPFVWYARSPFAEPLAAAFMLVVARDCLRGGPAWRILVLTFAVSIYKDTAAPFAGLIAWGACALGGKIRGRVIPAVIGAALGVATLLLYNQFRFATWANRAYIGPLSIVSDGSTQASFFLAHFFSPNGGLSFFWSLLAPLLVFAWFNAGTSGEPARARAVKTSILASCLAILALAGGLSKWFAPFGWVSWGNRLSLPWLPAILYLGFEAAVPGLRSIIARASATGDDAARYRRIRLGIATLAFILAFPHFRSVFYGNLFWSLFQPNPGCPNVIGPETSLPAYYQCMDWMLWPRELGGWVLWRGYFDLTAPLTILISAAWSGLTAWGVYRALRPGHGWVAQPTIDTSPKSANSGPK